jgi:hypothetical protein
VNIAKSKIRNKMGMQLLVILRIRIYFNVKNMCCKNFTSNATMLELFTSSMYNAQEEVVLQDVVNDVIKKNGPRYNFATDNPNEKNYTSTGNEMALKTFQT